MAKVDLISPGSEQTGNSVSLSNCDSSTAGDYVYMISAWTSSDGKFFGPFTPAGVSGSTLDITGWKDLENMTSWKSVVVIQKD